MKQAKLLMLGATLHCGTDVTKLSTDSPWMDRIGKFDYMSWAFPHTRTPNRDKSYATPALTPDSHWCHDSFLPTLFHHIIHNTGRCPNTDGYSVLL